MAESKGVSEEEVSRVDPKQVEWAKARDQIPLMVPKAWIETCPECLLSWIPNFKMGECPNCKGVAGE